MPTGGIKGSASFVHLADFRFGSDVVTSVFCSSETDTRRGLQCNAGHELMRHTVQQPKKTEKPRIDDVVD
jgi:hypothetical protein